MVNVPGPTIVSKSITANGTYNASSDNADGFDPVVVAVPENDIYIFHGVPSSATINCGFEPDYIIIIDPTTADGTYKVATWYDKSYSTSVYQQIYNSIYSTFAISNAFASIDNTGFTFSAGYLSGISSNALIIAIKE